MYNNALFVNTDKQVSTPHGEVFVILELSGSTTYSLITSSVLAGGSFIATNWSQAIFETPISADVIPREINALWHTPSSVFSENRASCMQKY